MQIDEIVEPLRLATGSGKESEKRIEANFESAMEWETNESEEDLLELLPCTGLSNEKTSSMYNSKQRNSYEPSGEEWDMDAANKPEDSSKPRAFSCAEAVSKAGDQWSKSSTTSTKKREPKTVLDWVTINPRVPGKGKIAQVTNKIEIHEDRKTLVETKEEINDEIDRRNVRCPVPGCGNQKGKGFRRNGISKHLTGQHQADLEKGSVNNKLISELLKSLDKKICSGCRTITKRFTELGLCGKCDKSRPAAGKVILDLTTSQREESTAMLMNVQKINLR